MPATSECIATMTPAFDRHQCTHNPKNQPVSGFNIAWVTPPRRYEGILICWKASHRTLPGLCYRCEAKPYPGLIACDWVGGSRLNRLEPLCLPVCLLRERIRLEAQSHRFASRAMVSAKNRNSSPVAMFAGFADFQP